MSDMKKEIAELNELGKKVREIDLSSAEIMDEDGYVDCPMCKAEGSVEHETYVNIDNLPISVQIFGIGDEIHHYQNFINKTPRMLEIINTQQQKLDIAVGALESISIECPKTFTHPIDPQLDRCQRIAKQALNKINQDKE